ncbi:MAG: hypothetical protein R3D34_14725 [Nitratireductor sp.]
MPNKAAGSFICHSILLSDSHSAASAWPEDERLCRTAGRPNVTIDRKTPATVLIGRRGHGITLTSSVMVEAVLRGREILYPKFCNTVVTRFEEKGACITLEKLEESHPAMDNYLAGKRVPRENYEAFLEETAWGGKGPDTIKRICDRLAAMAQGQTR